MGLVKEVPAAVSVRGLTLQYSSKAPPIIDKANLTVPKGAIYGLLGASGCGKTSLLKCLVGLQKPDSGTVLVFGEPLHKGLVPGPAVGFMPQELALLEDFTIAENMYFFGQLQGMPAGVIYSRISFLSSFFQLLPADRFVYALSGGQQRRVSLAVSLIHSPPFLILDEPTVGLDPVLRDSIWRYFTVLSKEGTTIVVTTHFIEEIAQAALVGVMRSGKIWCEQPPSALIALYGPGSLSDAYLKVCRRLDFPVEGDTSPPVAAASAPDVELAPLPAGMTTWANWGPVRSLARLRALVAKNLIKIMRRVVMIIFQLGMPSVVGVVFCLFVGGNPTDLPMGVVNEDPRGFLSKGFLDNIDTKIVHQRLYESLVIAFDAVRNERVWGAIYIPENYTENLMYRFNHTFFVDAVTEELSTIDVFMDATDYTIRGVLIEELRRAHDQFLKQVSQNISGLNISIELLKISDPFYQAFDFTFREFMSPGIIACILFALSITLTALLLVAEVQGGIRGRCAVAGLTTTEVIVGHALVQTALAYVQTVFMLVVFVTVFDTPVRGNLAVAFILPVLMSFTGMNFGFFTSAVSRDEATALLLSLAALYPALLMGGVLWPFEGTPTVLRPVSYAVPQALPVHGLRGVMLRNYTFTNRHVQVAIGANIGWTLALLALAMVVFAYSKT